MSARRTATDPARDRNHLDEALVRSAATRIGVRMALAVGALVVAGVVIVFGYLWWRSTHTEPPTPGHPRITVLLDPVDLAEAAVLGIIVAVVFAGLAARYVARQAVRPLADSLRRQREFVANASHELKTPVAVVDARAQQVQAMAGNDPSLAPVLAELRTDTRTLTRIIDEMLEMSVSTGALDGTADIASVARDVAAQLNLPDGPSVLVEATGPTWVRAPETALRRMISPLVDNALRFSPEDTPVRLSIAEVGRMVELRVIDEGPGIRGIDPDRVFDRFATGSPTTVRPGAVPRSSHGIGLALVREAARRCGGDALVETTGETGTTMVLRLPRSNHDTNA